jgi:hypothetical protein
MARRFGKSAITWTSSSEATEQVHMLQAPLRELIPAQNMVTYTADSLDRTVREVQHIGGGAAELGCTVRYDMGGQSLIDMIIAGSKGETLTWYPNLQDPDVNYTVKLIAPIAPTEIALDAQRARHGEHSAQLRFRRTDQTAFKRERFRGTDVLFAYNAGDSLTGSSFTRASDATYVKKGYGTLGDSTSNQARLTWVSTAGSTGFRDTPTLLLESSATNLLTRSNNFSTDYWSNANMTVTSGQTDPWGTSSGWLWECTGSYAASRTFAIDTTDPVVLSIMFKRNTSSGGASNFRIVTSSNAQIARVNVNVSSGIPSSVAYPFGSSVAPNERLDNGYWRYSVRTTGQSTASNFAAWIVPGTGAGADITLGVYQVEK